MLQLSAQLLDGAQLKFYQYEGDVNQLLDEVRTHINQLADSWTPEQKEHCLAETAASFQVWVGKGAAWVSWRHTAHCAAAGLQQSTWHM